MSSAINVRTIQVGRRVTLANGAEVEVVSNPQDGVWLFGRYLTSDDPSLVGAEEMIFAQDVVSVLDCG